MHVKNARLSFPYLFSANAFDENQKAKYSATFLLPEDDPQLDAIKQEISKVATEKWGQKINDKNFVAQLKGCMRAGSEKAHLDGFDGCVFFAASNTSRPTVVDRDKSPLVEGDGRIYAGCYVNVVVDFWAQDNAYGKRVNASLRGVQFAGDGEAFGGGRPAEVDEFEDISDERMAIVEESLGDILA